MSPFMVNRTLMLTLFKHFWSTFCNQRPANLVKASQWWQQRHQFDADASHVNQFFFAGGANLAKGRNILQKQNQIKGGREVNGYNTYLLNCLKNSSASKNQVLNSLLDCSVNWLFPSLLLLILFSQPILLIPKTMSC